MSLSAFHISRRRIMVNSSRISIAAASAFLSGILAVVCGILVLGTQSDGFLLGIVGFSLLALVLGTWGLIRIRWARGALRGKAFAGWGMGIPVCGFGLGFLLLPAT